MLHEIWLLKREDLRAFRLKYISRFASFEQFWCLVCRHHNNEKAITIQTRVHIIAVYVILEKYTLKRKMKGVKEDWSLKHWNQHGAYKKWGEFI